MERLIFKNGKVEDYTVVLSTRSYQHLGQLNGIRSVNSTSNLSKANEFSFTICKYDLFKYYENSLLSYKTHLKIKQELWEQIVDLKLIWVKELDEYYEIKVNTIDSKETTKAITATSLCEAELSQLETGSIEINTENDILRDDYEVTTFYNQESPKASLLHRILDNAPHYKIMHVDASLCNLQRTFTIDSTIYDFMIGECSEQFNCLFQFDSANRGIYVYDLLTVCLDCGERGDFYDICPECNSDNLQYFGEDTTILVDKSNLTDEIQLSTNVDSIKNCFRLVAGDDLMTATIRMLNPNGSDRIYYFSENQLKDMSEELRTKLTEYDVEVAKYDAEYKRIVSDIYDYTDEIIYLESGMMPEVEMGEATAKTEADKLTVEALSPIALTDVTTITSVSTVNSAITNYAKTLIKSGYVKLDVIKIDNVEPIFEYVGTDENGWNYGTWYGRLKITNYSDEEDVVETDYMTITLHDNYEDFVRQKLLKELNKEDDGDGSILNVLDIEELEDFKNTLTYYCMNRLTSFHNAIQGALNVLIQMNQAQESSDLYEPLYLPYYNKLQACQKEMDKRQAEIDEVQSTLNDAEIRRKEIQEALNFEKYLGEYYNEFCAYRREQKYSNENYISDGLSNTELIDRAQEFIDMAKQELVKSGETQYTISSTLYNLLVLPEFKPIKEHFKLGNWIRLRVDGTLYRLRLISYSISFDSIQTINVEFSTVSKVRDVVYEAQQAIQSAQSMAKSYGYVSKQASKGNEAQNDISDWKENGLHSALIQIFNNDKAEFIQDQYGILGRVYDDITGTYSPKQIRITYNNIIFTADNWLHAVSAIGEHSYTIYNPETNSTETRVGYGITAEFFNSDYMSGKTIIGGKIYSTNYSDGTNDKPKEGTFIDLEEGTLSLAGGGLTYKPEEGLKIASTAVEEAVSELNIVAKTLGIKAENIDVSNQKIQDDQIKSVKASQITEQITSDQIKSLEGNKLTGTVTVDAENINISNQKIQSSQIESIDVSQINGTVLSSQMANTLSNKTVSGSFSGSVNVSAMTTTYNGATYTGITRNIVLEGMTLSFVNGVLVNVS